MVERRTDTRLTTETVELYVCPVCNQSYEAGEMVSLALGADLGGDDGRAAYEEVSMVCTHCADSVFDYAGGGGSVSEAARAAVDTAERRPAISRWWTLVAVAVGLWIVAIVGIGTVPTDSALADAFAGAAIVGWPLLPIAVYFDAKAVAEATDWTPSHWLWVIATSVWFLNVGAGIAYLFKRHTVTGVPSAAGLRRLVGTGR